MLGKLSKYTVGSGEALCRCCSIPTRLTMKPLQNQLRSDTYSKAATPIWPSGLLCHISHRILGFRIPTPIIASAIPGRHNNHVTVSKLARVHNATLVTILPGPAKGATASSPLSNKRRFPFNSIGEIILAHANSKQPCARHPNRHFYCFGSARRNERQQINQGQALGALEIIDLDICTPHNLHGRW